MNRLSLTTTALATLVVATVGVLLVLRPSPNIGPPASAAPTQSSVPTSAAEPTQAAPLRTLPMELDAGTYATQLFAPRLDPSEKPRPVDGAVTFTVPDGWVLAFDRTSDVRLTPKTADAGEPAVRQPSVIQAWIRPAAALVDPECDIEPSTDVERTADALATWLHDREGLDASPVEAITIDGHAGHWLDVSLAPSWTGSCPGMTEPTIPLITEGAGSAGPVGEFAYLVGITGEARMRVILLDLGMSDLGSRLTIMIVVSAHDSATFDSFIDAAMPIVRSFRFQ